MVFNATFNNISVISWRSVLLVEETSEPIENHRPVASYLQTLSHKTLVVTGTDCTGSCKSNYHMTTAPQLIWQTVILVIMYVENFKI